MIPRRAGFPRPTYQWHLESSKTTPYTLVMLDPYSILSLNSFVINKRMFSNCQREREREKGGGAALGSNVSSLGHTLDCTLPSVIRGACVLN